jgi:hypothetical protein
MVIKSYKVIFGDMNRPLTSRSRIIAWLLCAVLVYLAIHARHCDSCNGRYLVGSSSQQTLVNHRVPDALDTCNGICSCCGLHGIPKVGPPLDLVHTVTADTWSEPSSPVPPPRSLIISTASQRRFLLACWACAFGVENDSVWRCLCFDACSRSL